ncbi:MAG: hemerythrin [Burkholderiaceae bacterium]|nr:hemerythrin [Burkholderiaceae bacterium]
MTILAWSDSLTLHQARIDQVHQEFVDLINEWAEVLGGDEDPLPAYARLLAHTEAHFAMEEDWMAATGFARDNCHNKQHAMVLDVMREVLAHTHAHGDLAPMKQLLPELVNWFPQHADMMDASLVFHMKQVGFDPDTGGFASAEAEAAIRKAQATPISSCGSSSCT